MKLKILGRVISKKNSKKWIVRGGKRFLVPSEAFSQFKNDMLKQIVVREKVLPPYKITYRFYLKGNLDIDLDNAQASINDVLQDKGAIENDKLIVKVDAEKFSGCKDWETILIIEHYEQDKK